MEKITCKPNTWIVWILAYGLLHILLKAVVRDNSVYLRLLAASELLYWLALFLFLRRHSSFAAYGLCIPSKLPEGFTLALYGMPVLSAACFGLRFPTAVQVFLLASAAFGEELAFRALLPLLIFRRHHISPPKCAALCSLLFALFHVLSAIQGQFVWILPIYAFCAGFAFCAMARRTKSILPGWLLHTALNLTMPAAGSPASVLLTMCCSAVFLIYGSLSFYLQRGNATI